MDAFLDEVDRELLPKVRDQRFANGGALIRRYRGAKVAWNKGRARVGALDETVNEISVACEFLASAECTSLHYETPVADTGKTIDFLVFRSEERPIYFDVKTVHPESGNSWAAYERMQRHFTPGANLFLEEHWMGGEIAHDFMQARRRFLEHTLCLEDKIESIGAEDSFYALIFCSNAFKWHEDHLEDFADFYRTGRHRADDHFGKVESHFMKEKGLSLRGTISSFCYLERPLAKTRPTRFRCNVYGWPIHK